MTILNREEHFRDLLLPDGGASRQDVLQLYREAIEKQAEASEAWVRLMKAQDEAGAPWSAVINAAQEAGMTSDDFKKVLGVIPSTLSRWLNKQSEPTASFRQSLAQTLFRFAIDLPNRVRLLSVPS